ncbi:sensor histidine kinase [Peptostreptococcus equinus]|uniref:histidine kinase n=1 Tax=Peptostreptococcus equinus TaxID=3003601 RepID=A0ABY7JRZ9_9FIRM|nr:HAMP domain-containing sensor histidine kinase [Peptostreptococcus sp. CBA3647]WAW14467.1 HAMP domain-containing sensor histidine kinase [Peptostreptococcus sp. CBA3647]
MKTKTKYNNVISRKFEYRRKLKYNLFRIPTYIVLATLLIVIVSFYYFSKEYVDNNTMTSMEKKFSLFDEYYNSPKHEVDWNTEEDIYQMVPVNSILIDESKNIIHPSTNDVTQREYDRVEKIAKKYNVFKISRKDDKPSKISIDNNTYYTKLRKYEGVYDESFVRKATIQEQRAGKEKVYIVILYTNISPSQNFIELMIKMLILLMLNFGLFSTLFIFLVAKEVDGSFRNLKRYIIGVGQGEKVNRFRHFDYLEFDDIANSVDDMADAKNKSEESKKIFFQNASHELRTPLMSIQGYAEGIESGVFKDSKRAAQIIIEESEKMANLVNEILLLSKIESNNIVSKKEVLNFKDIIHSCVWDTEKIAKTKDILINTEISDEEMLVYGDEEMLERVVNNILSNALRYAKTKIVVTVRIVDGFVLSSIYNDGESIDPNDMPHIFDRFYKGKNGNSGIGLSLAKDIITKHDGYIDVYSNDQGVTFVIKLNLHK